MFTKGSDFNQPSNIILAGWTVSVNSTINIAVSPGTFQIISYLGNLTQTVIVTGNVLTITVTEEPIYIVPITINPFLQMTASVMRLPLEIFRNTIELIYVSTYVTNPFTYSIDVSLSDSSSQSVTVSPGSTVKLTEQNPVQIGLNPNPTTITMEVIVNGFTSPIILQTSVGSNVPLITILNPIIVSSNQIPFAFQATVPFR